MSKYLHYFGMAIAACAGTTLIGQLMQYQATRMGAIALWFVLLIVAMLFTGGIFLALRKNPDVTGGQYFDMLCYPVGAIALLFAGLILGVQAG